MKPHKKKNMRSGLQHSQKRKKNCKSSETSLKKGDSSGGGKHSDQPMRKKLKTFEMPWEATAVKGKKWNKSPKDYKNIRRLQLLEANKEEDKNIHKLEKLLGVSKRKKKKMESLEKIPSMFAKDGLQFIFKPLDELDSEDAAELSDNSDMNFSEDEHEVPNNKESNVSDDDNQSEDFETQSTGSEESDKVSCESSDPSSDSRKSETKTKKPQIWEDIYGRLRDEDGNILPNPTPVSQAYVPPHQQMKQASGGDEKRNILERVKKQLKGLINRLSESNMNRIGSEIEQMFMKNSRNDMNETLMSILSEVLLSPVFVPPRFVMEQSALIALLHGNIGTEIGAFFLQSLALKFDELLNAGRNSEQGKECHNVLTFLCHLYNFKVTQSLLIFDILRLLVESFQEVDIELILLILKHAGFPLRKDDPLAFKEILLTVQSKAAALKPGQNQSRVKFMLDILIEVRNNNMEKMKKLLSYDPSVIEQLKKVLRSLVHKGSYVQELAISYGDLLKASEQGRWWIVGSAWSERTSKNATDEKSNSTLKVVEVDNSLSDKILPLAKKLRINTETRRIVFNAIMTAQDYMDAFESLLHLKLKNHQEREIISVLLHCSLHEKNFNPYYAYLASKLCTYDRRFREHMKFSLWDRFKELNIMKPSQRNCLASLLVHLFTTKSLDISVLKVIQFVDINKQMVPFLRKILTGILLHEREEVCCEVFQRIASNKNLSMLRDSLRLFMHHFILQRKCEMDQSMAEKLVQRVKVAEGALNSAKLAFKI